MNMRDVARRAGVSSATVSRVINGSSLVKEETAQRIRALLDEMNFIPNPVATTLKYGRSKTFGLIIPDICNPFFAEFLGAFEELLVELDHDVLVISVQSPDKLLQSIRRMLMRQVDGVVLMASEYDTYAIEPLLLNRIPIVTVDRRSIQSGCSDVAIDFESGFAAATRHLSELGHVHIGYIGGTPGLQTSKIRANAFRQGLQLAGLAYNPEWIRTGDYRLAGGEAAIASILALPSRPTALVTANDMTAFGVIRGLHVAGLSAGKHISLIGLDDVALTEVVDPPLTTIRISRRTFAKTCIDALNFTKQNVSQPGRQFSVETQLIIRESTRPLVQ